MTVLRIAFALGLLGYFVWRGRSCRLFLLGIPFLLVTSDSLFITSLRPLFMPGRVAHEWRVLGWLVLVWALAFWNPEKRGSRRPFGGPISLPEEFLLASVFGLVALNAVVSLVSGESPGVVASLVVTQWGPLGAGYLLVRGVFSVHSRLQTMQFLTALAWVSVLGAILFILHQGLGLHIYPGPATHVIDFQGRTLTVTVVIAPTYYYLMVVLPLCQERFSLRWAAMLAVACLALAVSYSRGAVFMTVALILGLALIRGMTAGSVVMLLRRLFAPAILVALAALFLAVVLPTQAAYFLDRFGGFGGERLAPDYQLARINPIVAAANTIQDPVFGNGFTAESASFKALASKGDTAWLLIVHSLGWVGVAMVAGMLAAYMYRAVRLSLRSQSGQGRFGLLLLGLTLPVILQVFLSSAFLDQGSSALGLWVFALVAVEAVRSRGEFDSGRLHNMELSRFR